MEIIVEYPSSTSQQPQDIPCGSGTAHHHVSSSHSRILLSQLASIRNDGKFCDVILIVENTRIPAHRVILAASSAYFNTMFCSKMIESRQLEIQMHDIDVAILESLVNFCYTGEITITETNVQLLLPAACLLQIGEIQEICCEFLKQQLDPTNCLGIRAFADTHACRELLKSADKYTLQNFSGVVNTEEFLMLPLIQLIEIISSEDLNVRSEEIVFNAVIQWVRYDLPRRRPHLAKVLEHVRLPLCHPKFIVSTVSEEILIKGDQESRDLVDEAKNYLLLPLERPNMQGPRTRPRKPVRFREILYAVGGWCSGDAIASVECLDPNRPLPMWSCVTPMKKRRCGVGVAVVNGLLYAVGGHDGTCYLNSVERYDPATNQWSSDVAPTFTPRTSVGVAVLDELLFAVGGQDGNCCLNVVECYDYRTNTWSTVAPMSTRRLGVSVSVLNGCLYAVGGSDGHNPLSTVERYDPRAGRWETIRSMSTPRKHLGSAVYHELLYAVGGRDDCAELSSAEQYNPFTNEWIPVVNMNKRRSGVGLAVVNDKLYAVGGFDGQTYLKDVEVYDKDTNEWKHHGSMNYRRLGGGVGVLRSALEAVEVNTKTKLPPGLI